MQHFSETDNITGISINKINGSINSNTLGKVADNKGITYLIRNIKYAVIVVGYWFKKLDKPHFISFPPSESNVWYVQYKKSLPYTTVYTITAPLHLSKWIIYIFNFYNTTPHYDEDIVTSFKSVTYISNVLSFGEVRYKYLPTNIYSVFSALMKIGRAEK